MKTIYIDKEDKPFWAMPKIKIEQDNFKIYANLEKEKNITKVIKKLKQNQVSNVVLSKELGENKDFKNEYPVIKSQ